MTITAAYERVNEKNYVNRFLYSEDVDVTFNFPDENEANGFKEIVKSAMKNGNKVRLVVDDIS